MMIELTFWGLSAAATSPAMKPLWDWLGSFSVDVANDLLKDFVKDDLIRATWQRLPLSARGRAVGRSLKAFVEAMTQELERLSCAPDIYVKPLKTFIKDRDGVALLGTALNLRQTAPEASALEKLWDELGVRSLPDGFDWAAVAMAYREAVQAIVRDSDELRAIAQFELTEQLLEEQRATADLLADRLGPAVGCDLVTYAERLRDRYSCPRLMQIVAKKEDWRRLRQFFAIPSVREIRDDSCLPIEISKNLMNSRTNYKLEQGDSINFNHLEQESPDSIVRSAFDLLQSNHEDDRNLIILGKPGSGKSTLLHYLALDWAEEEVFGEGHTRSLEDLELGIVPLLIELNLYAYDRQRGQCNTILDFIENGSTFLKLSKRSIDERLQSGRAYLLLDGLDEIFSSKERMIITDQIINLANNYPQAKIILTSRIIGHDYHRFGDTRFRHFEVQDFDDHQISQFIGNYYQNLTQQDTESCDRLIHDIQQSGSLRELSKNPLFLTIMATLNSRQGLSQSRFLLYEQATSILLHQWDEKRAIDGDPELTRAALDLNDKKALLQRVARMMQESPEGLCGNLIREEDLEREFRDYLKTNDRDNSGAIAKRLIRQLRERNFILYMVEPNLYAFIHRTFLEYFCSTEILERLNLQDLGGQSIISTDHLIHRIFEQHWNDDAWREVLILLASQLPIEFAKQAIISLAQLDDAISQKADFANLFLASDCLADLPKRSAIEEIDSDLWKRLRSLISWKISYGDFQTSFGFNRRIRKIKKRAVSCMAQHWQSNSNTLSYLKERILSDEDKWVRQAIMEELARGWQDDPDILSLLKERAMSDQDWAVQQAAVQVLAQGWKDSPDILPWLKERAISAQFATVRYTAVQALAQNWKDDPDTLPWLKERATSDQHSDVRHAAVEALAQGWKDDPNTLPLLKERAIFDQDNNVRRVTIEALAWGWKNNYDILPWLKERAISDQFNDVRQATLQALAKDWQDNPDTLSLLKERAQLDQSGDVRRVAVAALVQGWKDDSDTFSLLHKIAIQDLFQRSDRKYREDESNPRQTALEGLLEIAPDNPQVIDLLRDRAANDPDDLLREWATEQLTKLDS